MCLAYFAGHGYDSRFTAHMEHLLTVLTPETRIRLTIGTDIVCAACPNNLDDVCHKPRLVAAYDRAVLSRCGLSEGQVLSFRRFTDLVGEHILAPGLRATICGGCQWNGICSSQPGWW